MNTFYSLSSFNNFLGAFFLGGTFDFHSHVMYTHKGTNPFGTNAKKSKFSDIISV